MHSRIFQISTTPIEEDNLLASWNLQQEDYSFCDYIGDEVDDEERINDIKCLQEIFRDIFDIEEDHLVFRGGIDLFVEEWDEYIKDLTLKLEKEKDLHSINMYRIKNATEDTHLECWYRFYIEEWNGWPGPAADLISFVDHKLKPGDKLYIGSVIDYHF